MRKKIISAALLAAATFGTAGTAHAQLAVVDVKSVAQALQTARNTLQTLRQAEQLYSSLNSISNIRNVSNMLEERILRDALPDGMQESISLISGDLRDLGAIGTRAGSIMGNANFSLSGLDGQFGDAEGILNRAATAGARDQAYGEYMLEATTATSDGLNQLNNGLSASTTMRQAQDIAARASIENAAVNNRMLQMMAAQRAASAQASLKSSQDFAEQQRLNAENIAANRRPTYNGQ